MGDASMILAKNFVWMHIPKTGGTWFRSVMRSAPPDWGLQEIDGHFFSSYLDSHRDHLHAARMYFVRNPWDWYVSMFFFWHKHYWARTGGYVLPERKWISSELRWARWLEPLGEGCGGEGFRKLLPIVIEKMPTQSQYVDHVIGNEELQADQLLVGRFENLREEVVRLLNSVGCRPTRELLNTIQKTPPAQVSKHKHYRDLYDVTARELVAERETKIVEMGYEF